MQGFCWWEGLLPVVTLFGDRLSISLSVCQLRTFYEREPGSNIYISARVDAGERMRSLCLGETKAKSLVQHPTAMRGLQSIIFRSLFYHFVHLVRRRELLRLPPPAFRG